MKIGFDAKRAFNNLTGLGNYSRSVINSISKIDPNSEIYLFTPNKKNIIFQPNQKNIKIITPKKFVNQKYWRFQGLNKELNSLNIDVYHGLSNEIPIGVKTKSIVTIHDLLFLKYPKFYNFIDRKIYEFKSKKACKNADKIIATSHQTKEDIVKYFNIEPTKITVIYQSCHDDFINHKNHDGSNNEIQKHLTDPFILFIGSIEKRKNLIFLLKAIQKMPKIKLICVGKKTKYYRKVHAFIKKYKLENQIIFLNIKDTKTLSMIYRKSRGLVYPSIDEGFGIPIIEAMYSSIPVITSNNSIFQEIGGEDSHYFEQNNLNSLIEQIKQIWNKSEERTKRIQLNLNYVRKFNEEKQAKEIIKLYMELS